MLLRQALRAQASGLAAYVRGALVDGARLLNLREKYNWGSVDSRALGQAVERDPDYAGDNALEHVFARNGENVRLDAYLGQNYGIHPDAGSRLPHRFFRKVKRGQVEVFELHVPSTMLLCQASQKMPDAEVGFYQGVLEAEISYRDNPLVLRAAAREFPSVGAYSWKVK